MDNFEKEDQSHNVSRREFIETGLKAGGAALLSIPAIDAFAAKKDYVVQDIIQNWKE